MYSGRIVNEPGSKVDGTVIDGAFIGIIVSENDGTYHVEPAARYDEASRDAHVIVYHEDDTVTEDDEVYERVKADPSKADELKRELGCGLSKKLARERLMHIQDRISLDTGRVYPSAFFKLNNDFNFLLKKFNSFFLF
jgi:hypothetical protein